MSLYRDILMHQLGIRDGWINAGEVDLISEQANRDGPDTTLLRIDAITEATATADKHVARAHRRICVCAAVKSLAARRPRPERSDLT